MKTTRKEFLKNGSIFCLATMLGCAKDAKVPWNINEKNFEHVPALYTRNPLYFSNQKTTVSIVKVNGKGSEAKAVEYAVAKALDLIGGVNQVTKGKERILLKPNLVSPNESDTTKPAVIDALAGLMKKAGKDVCIGEASAASWHTIRLTMKGFVCAVKDPGDLAIIQNENFDKLGYRDVAKKYAIPLVNLHLGRMAKMTIPDNYVLKEIFLNEALINTDMVCSVPMMKTHTLAGVTLALKNVGIGAYPGLVYGSVRSMLHRKAMEVEPSGTATAIVDMVKANKIGLCVIDATTAMEGNGPAKMQGGKLLKMNLIIAGTNPLATDMVAADLMGFRPGEIDTFTWAHKAGMTPNDISDIRIVGENPADVRRKFIKPAIVPYALISGWYAPPC
ncbi:MAG: DUF362 domain-containing protein [Spirochaetes bacterium]|nr:DUF362 domain-containing protein [Spirochaetota bacterium]